MKRRAAIYVRVSTEEQTVQQQLDTLRSWAEGRGFEICGEFRDEGVSGRKAKRPALERLLRACRNGEVDIVGVVALDRLGRSLQHLLEILQEFQALGVDLYLRREGVDTSTPAGKLFTQLCGAFAEYESNILSERVRAGMERARRQGRHLGRPPRITARKRERILELVRSGMPKVEVAKETGISRASLYRVLAEEETD